LNVMAWLPRIGLLGSKTHGPGFIVALRDKYTPQAKVPLEFHYIP